MPAHFIDPNVAVFVGVCDRIASGESLLAVCSGVLGSIPGGTDSFPPETKEEARPEAGKAGGSGTGVMPVSVVIQSVN